MVTNNWAIITTFATTIGAIVAFIISLLTLKKLKLEIDSMKRAQLIKEPSIRLASMEEIERYGTSSKLNIKNRNESYDYSIEKRAAKNAGPWNVFGITFVIFLIGLLGYFLITSLIFRYVLLITSVLIFSVSIIMLFFGRKEYVNQRSMFNFELDKIRNKKFSNNAFQSEDGTSDR